MHHALSYSFVKQPITGKVMGIQVAILNLLRGYLKYSRQEKLSFLVRHENSQKEVEEQADLMGIDHRRLEFFHEPYNQDVLKKFDTVFRIDLMPGNLLQARPKNSFSFCGLAHTFAGDVGGQILEKFCLEPSTSGDAIICPSNALRATIQNFFDLYADYIERRFGTKWKVPVRLPVIPLGVDLKRFETICTPEKRIQQRTALDIKENDVVVLWVGRLSASIKAHPLAMFRAVENAARKTNKKVHFVLMGYFVTPEEEKAFHRMARDFCPTTQVHFVMSNDARFPDGLWAAGDIFLSLIDNMQESFGLTPIEAIAAGLPRVISDWDGYRDCVTQGVDGFLIPTIQPATGNGFALAEPVLFATSNYADTLAKTALCVAIDTTKAAEALLALIENPALRHTMAEAAKQRIHAYAWKNIIPAYETLWDELATERKRFYSRSNIPPS